MPRDAPIRGSERDKLMNANLPIVYLARHGETAWSLSGQYTGRTDLPLTQRGERIAELYQGYDDARAALVEILADEVRQIAPQG